MAISALLLTGAGCNRSSQQAPQQTLPKPSSQTSFLSVAAHNNSNLKMAPTSTPEGTLEAFTEALEANDLPRVLSFISASSYDFYQQLLPKVDLRTMGAYLRRYPPERIDNPSVDEDWSTFLTKRPFGNNQLEDQTITLTREEGEWKVLSF